MATFAEDAAEGHHYWLHCHACDRKGVRVTAAEMVERGWGAVVVVGCQDRLRCICGVRGKTTIQISTGYNPLPTPPPGGGAGGPTYWSDYSRRIRKKP